METEINKKDLVLFVGNLTNEHLASLKDLENILGQKLRIGLITGLNKKVTKDIEKKLALFIRCNMKKGDLIEEALKKIRNQILLTPARYETSLEYLSRIVPYLPYLKNPDSRALKIATDKLEMRKAFAKYHPSITPKFIWVKKYSDAIISEIVKEIGFPCVIKPTNLSKSRLIIKCYYKEELEKNLQEAFKKIKALYKQAQVEVEPKIIVEQFMEGQMYSIDAYVNSNGKLYYTPVIEIKTGKEAGYDDLFMYTQITPSLLDKEGASKAQTAVEKGTHAVGLKSCTVHCELMKTDKGWKVIELAARPGGFREELLYNSFGLKHTLNDFLIHLGKKPLLKKLWHKHTVFMKFWPHKAGKLIAIKGLKKAKELKSLVKFRQGKKVGEYAGLSKHGHTFVAAFTLCSKTRSDLLGDIRKLEKWIKIET